MRSFIQLEFDKIRTHIASECHSASGRMHASQIMPLPHTPAMRQALALHGEMQRLIRENIHFNFEDLTDVSQLITTTKHQTFDFLEFRSIIRSLAIANAIKQADEEWQEFPLFAAMRSKLSNFSELEHRFHQIFGSDGEVQDSASSELKRIRQRHRKLRKDISAVLQKKMEDFASEKMLHDKIITQRDGRFVIPVKEGATSFVSGIVHGRSGSKSSVYIEPQEAVGINNEMGMLSDEEKQEIFRIFTEFTAQIRQRSEDILSSITVLGQMDFHYAVGRFANHTGSTIPEISDEPVVKLQKARHPLLIKNLGSIKKVIPFDLELGTDFRLLLISGPNTGGKTVTLKSVGLLTLMALSGLPISADSSSTIGHFTRVFADIGDQQSLENALSTFSSHIKNIEAMVTHGDKRTLVLIDEIGAATDPEQGSALAQSILEELTARNVTGVITTHYTALKIYAEQQPNCINAAMQFDPQHHIPTYQFKLGLPGNSFAIEVASRLGLDASLIERAKELTGKQNIELTDLLKKMNEEKAQLSREYYQFQLKNRLLELKVQEYEAKIAGFEDEKKELKKRSLRDAREFLTSLQKELNNEIDSIQHLKKSQRKQALEKTLQRVSGLNADYGEKVEQLKGTARKPLTKPEIGMRVWVKDMDTEGEIVEIAKDSVKIDMDGIYFTTAWEQLYHAKPQREAVTPKVGGSLPAATSVRLELKVLGLTFDEAQPLVDEFIDEALVAGLKFVRIVHGKGTGALRSKIRKHLRQNRGLKDFFSPAPEAGGDGVTVVTLG
jgi:DNA mismatch repair protein MutS2